MDFLTSTEIIKVKKAIRTPVRNLQNYPYIISYIKKHNVYASMTSSPERLKKSSVVLSMILLSPYIKKIYINLPKLYRDKEPYKKSDIEFIKNLSSRIHIRRIPKDLGPISKILPTLSSIKDEKSIIISIDDDICYPASLINELIYYSIRYPYIIPGGAGFSFGDLEDFINRKKWPEKKPVYPDMDVIEGWGGIAYRKEKVNIDRLKKLNKLCTVCKLSDDLTLSYSFALSGIKRKLISNKYFSGNEDVFSFKYSISENALYKGSGTSHIGAVDDANMIKYKECLDIIANQAD